MSESGNLCQSRPKVRSERTSLPFFQVQILAETWAALLQLDKTDEALAELNEAIRCEPRMTEARMKLGELFAQSGRKAEAIAQYEAAKKIVPNLPVPRWLSK